MSSSECSSAAAAAELYLQGLSLLAEQMPAEALAAFTSAASLGHPAAHAAAAAVHFEGAVARDGSAVESNSSKAFDMCVLCERAIAAPRITAALTIIIIFSPLPMRAPPLVITHAQVQKRGRSRLPGQFWHVVSLLLLRGWNTHRLFPRV